MGPFQSHLEGPKAYILSMAGAYGWLRPEMVTDIHTQKTNLQTSRDAPQCTAFIPLEPI